MVLKRAILPDCFAGWPKTCDGRADLLSKVISSQKRYTRYFQFLSQSQSSADHFETNFDLLTQKGTKLWHFKNFKMKSVDPGN